MKIYIYIYIYISLYIVLAVAVNTACAPSQSATKTAIAQTEQASPTYASTLLSTDTSEPTVTAFHRITLSPTPDLRVFNINPKIFLLNIEDLPAKEKYYLLHPGWIAQVRNNDLYQPQSVETQRYIKETGRVTAWTARYWRGTMTVSAPEEIWHYATLYRTIEGAQMLTGKYDSCLGEDYIKADTGLKIGDTTSVCYTKIMQPSGENKVVYEINFTYRNLYNVVGGYGWENKMKPEYVQDAAKKIFAKLEAAPLSDTVTFNPDSSIR